MASALALSITATFPVHRGAVEAQLASPATGLGRAPVDVAAKNLNRSGQKATPAGAVATVHPRRLAALTVEIVAAISTVLPVAEKGRPSQFAFPLLSSQHSRSTGDLPEVGAMYQAKP